MQWPWRKRPLPPRSIRPATALRNLYSGYHKQRRLWAYIVISAVMLISLFVVLSLFSTTSPWVLAIPLVAIIFAVTQMQRCKELIRTLRQALVIQQQIERAQAEAEQQEAAEGLEAQSSGGNGEGMDPGGSQERGIGTPIEGLGEGGRSTPGSNGPAGNASSAPEG